MTREEAIQYLEEWNSAIINRGDTLNSQAVQALIMAIEALTEKSNKLKIGDEIYVHGYVDEIRNGIVIVRNEGGYFGTVETEIKKNEM